MKTVIFDVDDTLYDQIIPFNQALLRVFPKEYERLENKREEVYLRFRYYSDKVFHLTEEGVLSLDDMRVYRITEALNDFSIITPKILAKKFQEKYHFYQGKIVLRNDMEDLMNGLIQKKVTLGILTNGPTNHQKSKINQLGLSKYLDEKHIFISEEIGVAKPDINVFRQVEKALGVSADQLIYVGDSYENDVVGAKSAGWECIWLNKYHKIIDDFCIKPDVELRAYSNLKKEIDKLL